jgi:chaperonin GroEL (HSP60 family)
MAAVVAMLHGSTEGFLDDVERAVDDGINAYKVGSKGFVGVLQGEE